jgi:hypothetical protein
MRNLAAIGAWVTMVVFTLIILLMFAMWGLFAVVTVAQSLQLRATTTAIVLASDGPYTGAYQYVYTIADRTCPGTASPEPPLPKPATKIQIHYDPNNICESVTYNPSDSLVGVVASLVCISPWLALIVLVFWPRKKGPE